MAVILVVEDEAQVLVLAESYLEERRHTTLSANAVEQALA
jgi:CheY-like chemotaxis protein